MFCREDVLSRGRCSQFRQWWIQQRAAANPVNCHNLKDAENERHHYVHKNNEVIIYYIVSKFTTRFILNLMHFFNF